MIKIFLSVRNRLAITKKCITALQKHSTIPFQLYVYDNDSNYLIDEHFGYFCKMYKKGIIAQVTFTTSKTTFNAFSKASTCNFWGQQHEQDPNKDNYIFLLMLDNDVIVTPGWDQKLKAAWKYVKKNKIDTVKVIGQRPGGIKSLDPKVHKIGEMTARVGTLGGSGLWSVQPNFFRDVGFLNLKSLVGHDKKHDQLYWQLLQKASKNRHYIMGLQDKLGIHCGRQAGSVCNRLTRSRGRKDRLDLIKFEGAEKNINSMTFEEFFKLIYNDKKLLGDW